MLAASLFIGFTAFAILCILELLFAESGQEPPRWLDYIDGPYVRTKCTVLKGRDW